MSATSHALPPLGSRSGVNWGQPTASSSSKQGESTTSGFDSAYQRTDPVETPPATSFPFGTSAGKDSRPTSAFRRNDSPATGGGFSFTNTSGGSSTSIAPTLNGSRLFGQTTPSNLQTNSGPSFGASPSSTFGSFPSSSSGIHMSPNIRSPSFAFTPRGGASATVSTQQVPNSSGGASGMDSAPALVQDSSSMGLRRRVGGFVKGNNTTRTDRPPKHAPPKVSRLGTSFHDHDQGDIGKENYPQSISMHVS